MTAARAHQSFNTDGHPSRFIFYLMPGFSTLEMSAGVESLAAANEAAGHAAFEWKIVSDTGEAVRSASGLTVNVQSAAPDIRTGDCIVICCAFYPDENSYSKSSIAWLRQAKRRGARLCGLGGGMLLMAQTGLKTTGRMSVHWKAQPVFEESFFNLETVCTIFEVGSDIISCGGGGATLDLFSHFIAMRVGPTIANKVADRLLCTTIRSGDCRQTLTDLCRVEHRNPRLTKALELMLESLEDAVSPSYLASQVGMSTRQLERLFSRYVGLSPKTYMTILRLEKARMLLQQTQMSVIEVALACGFSSASHFSKLYRKQFNVSPHLEQSGRGQVI